MKKEKKQYTSVKIDKDFLAKALAYHADKNNLEPKQIKRIWFVNSLIAKYGAGILEELSR